MTTPQSLKWAEAHDKDYQETLKKAAEKENNPKPKSKVAKKPVPSKTGAMRVKVIPGRDGFICIYCDIEVGVDYDPLEDDKWIICPACKKKMHSSCIRVCKECLCGKRLIAVTK